MLITFRVKHSIKTHTGSLHCCYVTLTMTEFMMTGILIQRPTVTTPLIIQKMTCHCLLE
jgi:hypothetical protein